MSDTQYAIEPLGALKVFATLKTVNDRGILGWYYPLFVTREEAMAVDIEHGGEGIYDTLAFADRKGEFYHARSFVFKEAVSNTTSLLIVFYFEFLLYSSINS